MAKNEILYTTESGKNINKEIEEGKTLVANGLFEAIKLSKNKRSYYYDIYENGKTTGKYGVPL